MTYRVPAGIYHNPRRERPTPWPAYRRASRLDIMRRERRIRAKRRSLVIKAVALKGLSMSEALKQYPTW